MKGKFSGLSAISKLGIFILIIILSLVVIGIIGALIAGWISGMSPTSPLISDYSNPDTLLYMKTMQLFQSVGLFIVPPIIAAYLFNNSENNYLKLKLNNPFLIVISISMMVVAFPLINLLAEINQSMSLPESMSGISNWMKASETANNEITKYFLQADSFGVFLFNLILIALIPAIGEELLFRGIVQRLFSEMSKNIHIGIWVSAFLFSAVHMQFFTFLPRFLMGAMFGYFLIWSNSLSLTIAAHFVNNGLAVLINYLIQKGSIDASIETWGTNNIWASLISAIILFGGFYFIHKKKNQLYQKSIIRIVNP